MEIVPRQKVGPYYFGMPKNEVIVLLGYPQEADQDEWWYDDEGISFSFDEHGLSSIEILDPSLTLFRQRICDLTGRQVSELLNKNGFESKSKVEGDSSVVECQMLGLFFVYFEQKLDFIQAISLPEDIHPIVFRA